MRLPASSQCIKYLMFIFNLLFVISGIILLSIGLTIHGVFHGYHHFLDDKFFSVPSLLVAIGAIIFFIAFFGCCGAVRQNYCMLLTFTSLLVLVFIMELAAGISGYVLRSQGAHLIEQKMELTMKDYKNNATEIAFVWDKLQEELKCCGTTDQTEWIKILDNKTDLPVSCCKNKIGAIGNKHCYVNSTEVYPIGCYPKLANIIKSHAVEIGGAGIVIAFIQAFGIWFSIHLARAIKMSYETV